MKNWFFENIKYSMILVIQIKESRTEIWWILEAYLPEVKNNKGIKKIIICGKCFII